MAKINGPENHDYAQSKQNKIENQEQGFFQRNHTGVRVPQIRAMMCGIVHSRLTSS